MKYKMSVLVVFFLHLFTKSDIFHFSFFVNEEHLWDHSDSKFFLPVSNGIYSASPNLSSIYGFSLKFEPPPLKIFLPWGDHFLNCGNPRGILLINRHYRTK